MHPKVLKLKAFEDIELTISGVANKASNVSEKWYLFGNVEGVNKKELLLVMNVIGEFVEPQIDLSPSVVELQYDHGPYNDLYKLTGYH